MGAFIAFLLATAAAAMGIVAAGADRLRGAAGRHGDHGGPRARASTRAFYAPLRQRGAKPVTLLIASIGVTLMIQGLIRLFFGSGSYALLRDRDQAALPHPTAARAASPARSTSPQPQLLMVVVHRRSRCWRCTSSSPARGWARRCAPWPTMPIWRRSRASTPSWWCASPGSSPGRWPAMAGTMLALDVQLKPDLAFNIVLPIFAAAIVGGLGQAYGAIAGGFLIGFAETLAVFNWAIAAAAVQRHAARSSCRPTLSLVPTEYKLTVAFVILVVVLLVAPDRHLQGSLDMIARAPSSCSRACSRCSSSSAGCSGAANIIAAAGAELRLCADRARAQHPVGLWRAVQLRHHGLPDARRLCRHLHLLPGQRRLLGLGRPDDAGPGAAGLRGRAAAGHRARAMRTASASAAAGRRR